jgi:hypothetical protein
MISTCRLLRSADSHGVPSGKLRSFLRIHVCRVNETASFVVVEVAQEPFHRESTQRGGVDRARYFTSAA